jgi:hypothetical protein
LQDRQTRAAKLLFKASPVNKAIVEILGKH